MAHTRTSGVGIKFAPQALTQIDNLAAERGVSRAEIVRTAVSIGLPLLNIGVAINTERTLAIIEHTQLALSLLVERQYPEDAAPLIDMAFENVREYHG